MHVVLDNLTTEVIQFSAIKSHGFNREERLLVKIIFCLGACTMNTVGASFWVSIFYHGNKPLETKLVYNKRIERFNFIHAL